MAGRAGPLSVLGLAARLPLVVLFALAQPATARADGGRVTLLEPAGASAGARRCLTRIREELVAGGFELAVVDPGPKVDPVSVADVMERQQGSVAIIALLGDPEHGPAELWILDRVGAHPEVRRIPATASDAEHVPEVLAIRTIELLRASALKLLVESNRPPAPAASPAPAPSPATTTAAAPAATAAAPAGAVAAGGSTAAPAPPVRRTGPIVGLETGISLLDSVDGPGVAAIPLARIRVPFGNVLSARLTLAGLGTRAHVETTFGSASVAQSLGLVELCALFRPGRRLRPFASLGAGALFVRSDGQAVAPYQGASESRWAALADGGVGLLVPLAGDLALALEGHAFLAFPYPVVRFVEEAAATIGRPALMTTLTLVAWL